MALLMSHWLSPGRALFIVLMGLPLFTAVAVAMVASRSTLPLDFVLLRLRLHRVLETIRQRQHDAK